MRQEAATIKILIDTNRQVCTVTDAAGERTVPLYSDEAFRIIARWYVKVGWNQRYGYGFSWLGRPIIQLPDDVVRVQEVIHRVRPDLIIETGVAHGGSLVLYASLLEAIGGGEVIGVDIEIRPINRSAIENHPLARRISLIEGGSTDTGVINALRQHAAGKQSVLVILDSNHSYEHVTAELVAYAPLVTPGSYVIATDGIMEDLWDVPRGDPSWKKDNPARAARDFAAAHPEFVLEAVTPPFNEGSIPGDAVTHWPSAYLRRA